MGRVGRAAALVWYDVHGPTARPPLAALQALGGLGSVCYVRRPQHEQRRETRHGALATLAH